MVLTIRDDLPAEDLQAVVAELERWRTDGEAALRAAFDFAAKCTRGRNRMRPYNNYNPTRS